MSTDKTGIRSARPSRSVSEEAADPTGLEAKLKLASTFLAQRQYTAAATQAGLAAEMDSTGESDGLLATALYFDQKWEEARAAYTAAQTKSPDHPLATHWANQERLCASNLVMRPEVEVTDPRFARPDPTNTSFPKPIPDALKVQVTLPFTRPTLAGLLRAKAGRAAGWLVDAALGTMTAAIPDRMLFGSKERPRHTNWYVQKKALAALRIRGRPAADLLSVLKLARTRDNADRRNLFDSYREGARESLMAQGTRPPATAGIYRQTDGSWTDPDSPTAGASFTLFGRNTDPAVTKTDDELTLMDPSPAEVARVLLHCDRPQGQLEIPFLNHLTSWWIQFENHDWVVAGDPHPTEVHMVPLPADDPRRRQFGLTALPVPKRVESPHQKLAKDGIMPRTNVVTSWWDGSQVYGNAETDIELPDGEVVACGLLRSRSEVTGEAGKGAYLDLPDGHLPVDPKTGVERSGLVNRTWHLGLSFLHTLFAKEHNAIVDMLRSRYPSSGEEDLFQKARLINAAVMAKIHTVEWTPAVLPNRILNDGMNGNWYGIIANLFRHGKHREALNDLAGIQIRNREFGGIIGNPRNNHGVEYTLTQEFMSVYRLHSLIRESITFRSLDGTKAQEVAVGESRMAAATSLGRKIGHENIAYSAGTTHAGQLTLNNFPRGLTEMSVPGFPVVDLAMIDILRDREDRVPRFNEFRRRWGMPEFTTWTDLTDDPDQIAKLRRVYQKDGVSEQEALDRVDLLVGTLGSAKRPSGYGFGEELFTLFILNATRRLEADPFYTDYYDAAHYTQAGLEWVDDATMKGVLLRHYPGLAATGLANVENAFEPWDTDPAQLNDKSRHPLMHGGVDPIVE
ncbi:MAG: peroxidase family protein [Gemmatimonadota bacterium]